MKLIYEVDFFKVYSHAGFIYIKVNDHKILKTNFEETANAYITAYFKGLERDHGDNKQNVDHNVDVPKVIFGHNFFYCFKEGDKYNVKIGNSKKIIYSCEHEMSARAYCDGYFTGVSKEHGTSTDRTPRINGIPIHIGGN